MKWKMTLKIIGISFSSVIALCLITVLILSSLERVFYSDFFSNSKEIVSIYGLNEGYIPQGFTYSEKEDVFLASGYMLEDDKPSRIYQINTDNSSSKYVSLKNEDDTVFLGHCGGIGAYEDSVFVACDDENYNRVFVFSLSEIINSENGAEVKVKYSIKLNLNPAYICVSQDTLFVGEFYKEGSQYVTNLKHHQVTTSGETNHAFCYAFDLEKIINENKWEIEYVMSLPDKVQGLACLEEGKFAISTSWSIASSHLNIYENVFSNKGEYNGLDLYYLENNNLTKTITLPPMSEEIQVYNDMILVNFESAGNKYKLVNIYRQTSIWGYKFA